MASPVGEFGIAYRRLDHAQPLFDGNPGATVYPVFHVIRAVAGADGTRYVPAESSDSARVRALACRAAKTTRLMLANLRETPVEVTLPASAAGARIWTLDETTFDAAIRDPKFSERTTVLREDASRCCRLRLQGSKCETEPAPPGDRRVKLRPQCTAAYMIRSSVASAGVSSSTTRPWRQTRMRSLRFMISGR